MPRERLLGLSKEEKNKNIRLASTNVANDHVTYRYTSSHLLTPLAAGDVRPVRQRFSRLSLTASFTGIEAQALATGINAGSPTTASLSTSPRAAADSTAGPLPPSPAVGGQRTAPGGAAGSDDAEPSDAGAALGAAVSSVSSVSSAPGASSSLTCRLAMEKQAGDHYVTTVALSIARAVPAVTPAHLAMRKQAAGEPRAKKWVTRKERGGKAMPWKVLPPCVSRSRQITLPSE